MRMIVPALLLLLLAGSVFAEVAQERVRDVAKGLACLCGTCPRRPLDECACGWADQKRARIAEALEAGQDREAIIAGFVAEFGQEVYVTPPASGFNLSAWIMPIMALLLGGVVLGAVLRGWSRQRGTPAAGRVPEADTDDPYRLRLEKELRERDL
ncbi:MAG: cytochrome c-type biogenesis protein CcmH [Gemmatimonadota bacterium]|nr:cytochrome c-type biogenesis protein CcmH [Gemmatimonadota bacterium]